MVISYYKMLHSINYWQVRPPTHPSSIGLSVSVSNKMSRYHFRNALVYKEKPATKTLSVAVTTDNSRDGKIRLNAIHFKESTHSNEGKP